MKSETTNNDNNTNSSSTGAGSNSSIMIEQRMTALYGLAGGGTKPFWNTIIKNQKEKHDEDRENGNNNNNNCDMNQHNIVDIKISNYQLTRIAFYILIILTCCNVLLYPSYRSTDFDVHRHWKALTYNIPIIHWYSNNTYIPITTTKSSTTLSSDRMNYYNSKYSIKPIKTVETVHTLDYPPGFALLEYMMVHNIIVQSFIYPSISNTKSTNSKTNNIINYDQCFYIMDDITIYNTTGTTQQHEMITKKCIAYMRTTVIIFADLIYWLGSFCLSFSLLYNNNNNNSILSRNGSNIRTTKSSSLYHFIIVFLLLIFHPTMIWLDHVHFQYNGTMLGLLLLSISCLLYANHNNNNYYYQQIQINTPILETSTATISTTMKLQKLLFNEHTYHIIAIMIFGIVLTLKHLYITNSLWFIVYILRRYCCTTIHIVSNNTNSKVTTHNNDNNNNNNDINNRTNNSTNCKIKFIWHRLIIIIIMGSLTVLLPFIPFFIAIYNDTIQNNNNTTISTEFVQRLQQWFLQVKLRLFPFQRGLVHSYWAGNVWAIYITMYKISNTILQKLIPFHSSIKTIQTIFQYIIPSPQFITPRISLFGMILGQLPGLILVYKAAQIQSNQLVLQSFIIVSLGTFLFQYHAHEKAIVTSLLPCIVWYASIIYNNHDNNNTNNSATNVATDIKTTTATINDIQEQSSPTGSRIIKIEKAKCIVFDMNAYSILSLYPLIYPTQELLLKVSCTILYMSFLSLWLYSNNNDTTDHNNDQNNITLTTTTLKTRNYYIDKIIIFLQTWYTVIILIVTILQYEIPYIWLWGKYEFIPLGITSIVCSIGYISIYIRFILF